MFAQQPPDVNTLVLALQMVMTALIAWCLKMARDVIKAIGEVEKKQEDMKADVRRMTNGNGGRLRPDSDRAKAKRDPDAPPN